jgi:hypothetical protein
VHYAQKTVFQTHDPDNGGSYVQVLELHDISLPVDPYMPVRIDGERWTVVGRRSVSIDTRSPQCIVTVITIIRDDGPAQYEGGCLIQ